MKTDNDEEYLQTFTVRYRMKSHNRSGWNIWAQFQKKALNSLFVTIYKEEDIL
jgi:hypothetical protein